MVINTISVCGKRTVRVFAWGSTGNRVGAGYRPRSNPVLCGIMPRGRHCGGRRSMSASSMSNARGRNGRGGAGSSWRRRSISMVCTSPRAAVEFSTFELSQPSNFPRDSSGRSRWCASPDRGNDPTPTVETQNFSRYQLSDDPPIVTTRGENRRNYCRLDSQRADVIFQTWPGDPDRGNELTPNEETR